MTGKNRSVSIPRLIAAVLIALAAVWRLADAAAVPENTTVAWVLRGVLLVVFTGLLYLLFNDSDRRMKGVAYPLGFVFACFIVLGRHMSTSQALPQGWTGAWVVLAIVLYTIVCGAAVRLLYRGMLHRHSASTRKPDGKESLFSRVTGNWFFAFFLLLLCWVPVWLAFYPGTFRYDADTQFYTYVDDCMTTHHPLLHTLLLGAILDYGVTLDSLTLGVALYCVAQLVVMAAILAYAVVWLRRRQVPLGLRIAVLLLFALLPLYPLWSISVTKDVLFGGLVLLTCLQMVDLWRDGVKWLRSPLRIIVFIATVVLMTLMRNNGVYALCLTLPFAVLAAKDHRILTAILLLVCVAGYQGANQWLVDTVYADEGSYVEILSTPLQQVMRAAVRGEVSQEDMEKLAELYAYYDGEWRDLYTPMCADNAKWNLDEDVLTDSLGEYAALWWRVGLQNPRLYAEAFLQQNLPYFYPGAKMEYNIVLGLLPMDLYSLEEQAYLPQLQPLYEAYDETLTVFGLPGTGLLSDNAIMVWLTLLLLGFAIYRKQRGLIIATVFLLAVWGTCLLGPIAVMRYMLGFFYTTPVLLAFAFSKTERVGK